MSLLTSTASGFALVGWKGFLRGCLVVWLAPAGVAALALALQLLAGTRGMGGGWSMVWQHSILLMVTPMLSWFLLVIAAPLVPALMNRGWFGYLPALITGAAAGALVGTMLGSGLLVGLGALMLLGLRGLLGWWFPGAFQGAD